MTTAVATRWCVRPQPAARLRPKSPALGTALSRSSGAPPALDPAEASCATARRPCPQHLPRCPLLRTALPPLLLWSSPRSVATHLSPPPLLKKKNTRNGSRRYRPPELLVTTNELMMAGPLSMSLSLSGYWEQPETSEYSFTVDTWAVGCVMAELATGANREGMEGGLVA